MNHRIQRSAGPLLATLAVAGGGLAASSTASAAPAHHPPIVGHVYVNDNTGGTNTVAAFDRLADGSLAPVPGSPFPAGGAGTGAGLASQGSVQLADGGRFVIAVDAGSNQISVLEVDRDGALTPTPSSPVSSGGEDPVSVAVHGHLVYVANAGTTGTNYTGFWLTHWGSLIPISGTTVALPSDAQPGDVLFDATGTRLVGTEVGDSTIDSFAVSPRGGLRAAPGSPFAAQGIGPFGSVFSPVVPGELFVTNAHNPAGDSTVSSFIDADNGTLTPVGASPVANGQSGTCWAVISPDGRTLYTVNTGSGSLTSYAVRAGGALTVDQTIPIANGAGAGNSVDAALSPDGRYLYLDQHATGAVAVFAVQGGQLTQLTSDAAALPAGAAAAGIAVQ